MFQPRPPPFACALLKQLRSFHRGVCGSTVKGWWKVKMRPSAHRATFFRQGHLTMAFYQRSLDAKSVFLVQNQQHVKATFGFFLLVPFFSMFCSPKVGVTNVEQNMAPKPKHKTRWPWAPWTWTGSWTRSQSWRQGKQRLKTKNCPANHLAEGATKDKSSRPKPSKAPFS